MYNYIQINNTLNCKDKTGVHPIRVAGIRRFGGSTRADSCFRGVRFPP